MSQLGYCPDKASDGSYLRDTTSERNSFLQRRTSGGVSGSDAPPFNPQARNDLRLDVFESDRLPGCLAINDDYYDHRDAERDINCIFPVERLRELAAEGIIGSVAPHHYSGFMGRIYTRSAVVNEAAPALALRLKEDRVDAAALVPA